MVRFLFRIISQSCCRFSNRKYKCIVLKPVKQSFLTKALTKIIAFKIVLFRKEKMLRAPNIERSCFFATVCCDKVWTMKKDENKN